MSLKFDGPFRSDDLYRSKCCGKSETRHRSVGTFRSDAHHDRSKGSGRSSGPIRIDDPHRSDGSYQTDGYLGYNINYSYNTTTSNDIVNAASYISYRPLIHVDVFAVLFMNDLKNLTYVVIGTLGKHVHKQSCSHDFYFI